MIGRPPRILLLITCLLLSTVIRAQQKHFDDLGAGNPLLPGYFADPTIRKFGDTYYIYATTDGNGGGFGPAQVWMSKDFVNWSLQDMNWPTTHYYWAPDVNQAADGKYYMYYCQPVEIFGAWANSPVGPWTALLPEGQPVVKNFLVPNVITLDGQTFKDDDGKMYLFWGTWGIYPDHGCGVGLLNPDMKSFAKLAQIPNTIAKDFFEAPFMFKRKGLYYLTYSSGRCEDDTYRVQYAVSKTGPMGPFVFGKNNPVLITNADGTVHGPGHQSVLQEGDDFYIIYHRHNNPHSGGGYHRQVAADKIVFDADGNIAQLIPSHTGVGYLAKNVNPSKDHLLGRPVSVSSSYSNEFRPEFAVDHNNGTLWKPQNNTSDGWLTVDMGAVRTIKSVHTQFEYATWYYQYLIEYSLDGTVWKTFADQRNNTVHGSPMIDVGNVKGRYLKISIINTEYPGLNKGIWNIQAFSDDRYHPQMQVKPKDAALIPHIKPQGLLVDLDARSFGQGSVLKEWKNAGSLGGTFTSQSKNLPTAEIIDGKKAVVLAGKAIMKSSFQAPASLSGNSSFSISMWLHNPVIEDEEPVISWTARGGIDMTNASIGYGANKKWGAAAHWGWADMPYQTLPEAAKWHHIALVFDGTTEKLYVDGHIDRKELKMLYLANLTNFVLGSTADQNAFYSGAIASLKVYDVALAEDEILRLSKENTNADVAVYLNASKLAYGQVTQIRNEGYAGGAIKLQQVIKNEKYKSNMSAAELKDYRGRIAVVLQAKTTWQYQFPAAEAFLENNTYAIVYDFCAAGSKDAWHHVVQQVQNGEVQYYVDGIRSNVGYLPSLQIKNGQLNIESTNASTAIASMTVYNHSLSNEALGQEYERWKLNTDTLQEKAAFEQNPEALSTTMLRMKAKQPQKSGKIYQYNFTINSSSEGLHQSGWLDNPEFLSDGRMAGTEYSYSVKWKDNYGNVSLASPELKVNTNPNLFNSYESAFNEDKDFTKTVSGTIFDNLEGRAEVASSTGGSLKLSSAGSNWDGNSPLGPFLYKNITGDFIAEVKVADVSGLEQRKTNGANDVGLMLRQDSTFQLIQNSIFPGWGIGNMVTSLDSNGRAQTNNQTAWKYYPYLQIQRSGQIFYIRASEDGLQWTELPGSPLIRPDLGATLKVGLFHATYGKQSGYGTFEHFKIIQRKKQ